MSKRGPTKKQLEDDLERALRELSNVKADLHSARKGEAFLRQHQQQNERLGSALSRIAELADDAIRPAAQPSAPEPGMVYQPPQPRESTETVLGRIAELARVDGPIQPVTYGNFKHSDRDEREPRYRKL